MEEEYKGKNIKIVSVSSDRTKTPWIKSLDKLELKGIQLLDAEGKLKEALNVTGIPRYVIYSPEGKLININAPRPSSGSRIRGLFNRLLNK